MAVSGVLVLGTPRQSFEMPPSEGRWHGSSPDEHDASSTSRYAVAYWERVRVRSLARYASGTSLRCSSSLRTPQPLVCRTSHMCPSSLLAPLDRTMRAHR